MTKGRFIFFTVVLAIFIAISFLLYKKNTEDPVVRIGWQSTWATQGQLAETLQKTTIDTLNDLKTDFKVFTAGPPLSEAALAGELDVAFVGDQPAITLISKNSDWKIIGRLMDFRTGIVVPSNSKIKSVADLKGKRLGIPFGTSAHRVALQILEQAGLKPDIDVKIVNINITLQNEIVKKGKSDQWEDIDAFASWDHNIANYEKQGWARIIVSRKALGVVMMSEKFMLKHKDVAQKFMNAFKLAYFYYAKNQDQANRWFSKDTQGKIDIGLLTKVAEIEPNISAKSLKDIHVEITAENKEALQGAADFAFKNKLIKSEVNLTIGKTIKTIESTPDSSISMSEIKLKPLAQK